MYKKVIEANKIYKEIYKIDMPKNLKLYTLKRYKQYNPDIQKKFATIPSSSPTEQEKELLYKLYNKEKSQIFNNIYKKVLRKNNKKCASCFLTPSLEVDHFLPHNEYQEYSIFENNLIPICSKCNKHRPKFFRTLYVEDFRNNINFYNDKFIKKAFFITIEFNSILPFVYINIEFTNIRQIEQKVLSAHLNKFTSHDNKNLLFAYKENILKFFKDLTESHISEIYLFSDFDEYWTFMEKKLTTKIDNCETLYWLSHSYKNNQVDLNGYKNFLKNIFINKANTTVINAEPWLKKQLRQE